MASAHELRGRYGGWSSAYDRDTARFGWCAPAVVLRALAEHQSPVAHLRVLDLGVGTGQASRPYLELGAAVTGLDLAPEMLAQARQVNGSASYFRLLQHDLNEPLETLGFERPFDTIIGVGVLHFVHDLQRLTGELASRLSPGGVLAFSYIAPQVRSFSSATVIREAASVGEMVARAGLTLLEHRPFVAYYDQGDQNDPVEYRLVIARDPRPAVELSPLVASLDKTACIDRARVVRLAATSPQAVAPTQCSVEQLLADRNDESSRWDSDVLVVLAHPDDESIYLGGTLARLASAGHRIDLLTLTDGAGGRSAAAAGQDSLAQRRSTELKTAAAVLGIRRVEVAEFADFGKTADALRERPYDGADALDRWGPAVVDHIADAIDRHRPRVVLSFHPEHDPNFSLHGHHLACGEACKRAMAQASFQPRRHLAVVHPQMAQAGLAVAIEGPALEVKRQAIAAHASQAFSSARLLERLENVGHDAEGLVVLGEHAPLPASSDLLEQLFGPPTWAKRRTFADASVLPRILAGDAAVAACYEPPRSKPVEAGSARVCTGQQVGLAGGPAYVLAKALGALELGNGSAMFWMATQDHDWEEIATASVWAAGSRHRARFEVAPEHRGRPVGRLAFGPDVAHAVAAIADRLEGPFAREAAAALQAHYRPGTAPHDAFAGLCRTLWLTPGLEMVAPHEARRCDAAIPLVRRLLHDPKGAADALETACNALEALDVTPPVSRDALPLFFHDARGHRQSIRIRDGRPGDVRFDVGGVEMTRAQLETVLEAAPDRFSPDVLLRPAWQDAVLETTDYVAGPSEFVYWGQAYALHRFLEVDAATVWLRPTFRVTTRRTAGASPELGERAAEVEAETTALIEDRPRSPQAALETLRDSGDAKLDATLEQARQQLTSLPLAFSEPGRDRGKAIRVLQRATKALKRAQRRSEGAPDPSEQPNQDRTVWWLQLYAKHGPEMIDEMRSELARLGPSRWGALELVVERGLA